MMFAINKATGEKVNSLRIGLDASYQNLGGDVWLADPDNIENYEEVISNIGEIVVVYVSERTFTNYNGKRVVCSPHFRVINATELGINVVEETKEHKMAKNWIYQQLKEKDLTLWFSEIRKPFKYKKTINISDFEFDINLLGVCTEVSVTDRFNRRVADIICPFKKYHHLFGWGIVFEVQFSKQREKTTYDRTVDWALKGFSVCWIFSDDFDKLEENTIALKNQSLRVDSFSTVLRYNNKEVVKQLKFVVQEQCRLLEQKKKDISEEVRKEIEKSRELILGMVKGYSDELVGKKAVEMKVDYEHIKSLFLSTDKPLSCPRCKIGYLTKKEGRYGEFWGCSEYPECNKTIVTRRKGN